MFVEKLDKEPAFSNTFAGRNDFIVPAHLKSYALKDIFQHIIENELPKEWCEVTASSIIACFHSYYAYTYKGILGYFKYHNLSPRGWKPTSKQYINFKEFLFNLFDENWPDIEMDIRDYTDEDIIDLFD